MTILSQNVVTAITHGLKVALHVAVAIVVYGVVAYVFKHPTDIGTLEHYGLTIGVVNSVLAAIWKWAQLPIADLPTIDTAPPANVP